MSNKMIYIFMAVFLLGGCKQIEADPNLTQENLSNLTNNLKDEPLEMKMYSFIDEEGNTLESRIGVPKDFQRINGLEGSLVKYLRELTLKPDGSPVLLFNGNEKGNDSAHIAVVDFDIGNTDLQQCADSVIKIYAEYFWSLGAYDQIQFHLTNGFLMKYTDWRDGNRIEVNGNNVQWVHTNAFDDSYECFREYLIQVYIYAGTLSLSQESQIVSLEEVQVGDIFIEGGSPGHCVIVVDLAKDSDGNKCFLLAQGYMPAQDFHILNNPLHLEDPWYYESEISVQLLTPQYTFGEGSLRRWNGF